MFLGIEQQVQLAQLIAPYEGRVRNGDVHRHGLVGGDVAFEERHRFEVLMVSEGILGHARGARIGVAGLSLVGAGIDYGISHIVGYILNICVVNDVLHWCGDDVAATHDAHLMNVRKDVGTHAFLQALAAVVSGPSPSVGCNDTARRAHGCMIGQEQYVYASSDLRHLCG